MAVVKIAGIVLKISHGNVNKSKNKRLLNQRKKNRQRSRKKDAQGEQERHFVIRQKLREKRDKNETFNYGLTRQELIEWAEENGEKKFRADQIWEWLYRKRVQSFEEMTNLSKDLIAKLNDQFVVNPLKQRIVQESADGTVKYLSSCQMHVD